MKKINEIFKSQPKHVTHIPLDLEIDKFGQQLLESEYDYSKKTLFLMEGLLMYISLEIVDQILSFIVNGGHDV